MNLERVEDICSKGSNLSAQLIWFGSAWLRCKLEQVCHGMQNVNWGISQLELFCQRYKKLDGDSKS